MWQNRINKITRRSKSTGTSTLAKSSCDVHEHFGILKSPRIKIMSLFLILIVEKSCLYSFTHYYNRRTSNSILFVKVNLVNHMIFNKDCIWIYLLCCLCYKVTWMWLKFKNCIPKEYFDGLKWAIEWKPWSHGRGS